MKRIVGVLSIATIIGFVTAGSAMALNITTSNDGTALANNLLGSGITISNVTYSGGQAASGFFTDGLSSGIGMDEGIILTSGNAALAPGPNTSTGAGASTGSGSDADLQGLIPGYSIHDATVLEFDFESVGGDVYFNFVFASEEYLEYVNSNFNDVFGFFLDGQNIAKLADDTVVSIDTVNDKVNAEYYNDNNSSVFDLQYDGFTDVLTASFAGLSAGTHHIKLAIGDAGDSILDSAVFLQAGTFSDTPTSTVPEPGTMLLLSVGLMGVAGLKRRLKK